MKKYLLIVLVAVFSFVSIALSETDTPQTLVEKTIDSVRRTIKTDQGNIPEEELDEKLKSIVFPVFDFDEMSRRSLGKNWKKGDAEQQKEFITIFSELLSDTYINKIKDTVTKSAIDVVSEEIRGNKSVVKTAAKLEGEKVAIDYRFRLKEDAWQVYDVVIENIGLVSNYRNEFSGIIRKEGFDGLLKLLRKKRDKKSTSA